MMLRIKQIIRKILFLFIVQVIFYSCLNYDKDYRDVKARFEAMNNVTLLELTVGNYDTTLEEISARVVLEDSKTEIVFGSSLTDNSFIEPHFLKINEINDWVFFKFCCSSFESYQDNWWEGNILVLPNHSYLGLKNIQDVIYNIEKIDSLVQKIPEYPAFTKIPQSHGGYKYICKMKKEEKDNFNPSFLSKDCKFLYENAIEFKIQN